jgi:hypothetical protein
MRVEIEKSSTVTVGMGESRGFAFEFNETMFDMMSSKTYTDPIRAVIRELACNALDAHTVAGNSEPFTLHLPTTHEPWFEIRDNGVGMNDAEINTLFTMYGGSNKRGDNRTIGALGIGSKSPFAYTKLYTVTSTKDGVTYTYTCHVHEGKPRLSPGKTHQTPDAPNGVTINFAVKEGDIWEFENKAKTALEFISPMPAVNVKTFLPHKQSYLITTPLWSLRREARTAHHGYTCRAIMGNVQYQVGNIDESRTNALQKKILEMPIDMFFNLGDLDFASSRESLQLTPKTISAILGMCDRVVDDTITQVREKIDACQNVWEAHVLLFSIVNQTSSSAVGGASMGKLIEQAIKDGKLYGQYKNFNFVDSVAAFNALDYNHVAMTQFKHNSRHGAKRAKKEPIYALTQTDLRTLRQNAKTDPSVITANRHEIEVKPNVVFCINDTNVAGDKYLHYYIHESREQHKSPTVYMIHRNERDTDAALVSKNGKKLSATLGNPPTIMLSTLVAEYAPIFAARRPMGGGGRKSRAIAVLNGEIGEKRSYTQKGWTKAWRQPTDAELAEDKKFYVVIEKMVATQAGFENAWKLAEFVENVRYSGKFGITTDTPIFGVRKGHPVLKNNTGEYVELMSHVFSRVQKVMTPQKTLSLSLYVKPFNDECDDLLKYIAAQQPLTSSPVQQFAMALDEAKGVKENNWAYTKRVLDYCEERGKYTPGTVVDFNKEWQKVRANYPMLQYVTGWTMKDKNHRLNLLQYIQMVDDNNLREALAKGAASNS